MARLPPVDVEQTQGKTRVQFGGVANKLRVVPNMLCTLARSPAALEGYLGLAGALGPGREQ